MAEVVRWSLGGGSSDRSQFPSCKAVMRKHTSRAQIWCRSCNPGTQEHLASPPPVQEPQSGKASPSRVPEPGAGATKREREPTSRTQITQQSSKPRTRAHPAFPKPAPNQPQTSSEAAIPAIPGIPAIPQTQQQQKKNSLVSSFFH